MDALTYQIEAEVGRKHWWFQARRDILRDVLGQLRLPPNPSIYDLGCGTGQNLIMLQELGDATGIDMSELALAAARDQGCRSVMQGNLYDLPLGNDHADVVVAADILEHLDDDMQGAKEIHRVIKPDGAGVAVILVPAFMWLWGGQDDVSHHKRRYTRPELRTLLEGAGFEIQKLSYFNFFLFPPILAGRLLIKLKGKLMGAAPEGENHLTPGAMNGVLRGIFASERLWLRHGGFPVGVSLVAIARKRAS